MLRIGVEVLFELELHLLQYLSVYLFHISNPIKDYCVSIQCAREGARCDYGLYVGASTGNCDILNLLSSQALALKMYLNTTFSSLKLDSMDSWIKVGYC